MDYERIIEEQIADMRRQELIQKKATELLKEKNQEICVLEIQLAEKGDQNAFYNSFHVANGISYRQPTNTTKRRASKTNATDARTAWYPS